MLLKSLHMKIFLILFCFIGSLWAQEEKICHMILIRHGETDWNAKGKRQGWNDIPLNEEGRKQARELSEKFAKLSVKAVYASSLSRAVETAEILAKPHEGSYVVPDPTLRFYRNQFRLWNFLLSKEYKKKRMFQEIVQDSMAYFQKMAYEYAGETVLVVTHRRVIRYLLDALGETPYELDNGGFICLASDGKKLWIKQQKDEVLDGKVSEEDVPRVDENS